MSKLVLTAPLSFWGGFDPGSGEIIDRHHPQCGESVAGRVLHMPGTRGSTSSPGALVEAIRLGCGPEKIVLPQADMTVLTAVFVARELYGIEVPVEINEEKFSDTT